MNQVVEVPNVSWEDIGGLENVKRELQEVNETLALDHILLASSHLPLETNAIFFADCSISSGTSRKI